MIQGGHQSEPVKLIRSVLFWARACAFASSKSVSQAGFSLGRGTAVAAGVALFVSLSSGSVVAFFVSLTRASGGRPESVRPHAAFSRVAAALIGMRYLSFI